MKRIISSILVVVMLVLSLASCGYSFKDDDMTDYATFSDADKAAFEAALLQLLIKDGEFKLDDEIREEKVLENVYAAIAEAIGNATEDQKKEGKPEIRDVVYYTYYATALIDGEVRTFFADKMKNSSPLSIQLRKNNDYGKDELSAKIAALFNNDTFEFVKRAVYASATSGKAYEGDIAFVSYSRQEKNEDGTLKDESETFTNTIVTIGKAPEGDAKATTLESYLSGKSIASSIDKIDLVVDGKTYSYSSIKINYVASRIYNGITETGDKAYVSYTIKNKNGDNKSETVTNELVIVGNAPAEGATAASLAEYIAAKEIGNYVEGSLKINKTIEVAGENDTKTEKEVEVEYSNVKINWVASECASITDRAVGSVTDVTYEAVGEDEDETKLTDVAGKEHVVNGVEFTYYVYPVYYVETPEYTTELLIDKVYGEDLTADVIYQLIFIQDYLDLDDDATQDDADEINKKAENYKSGEQTIEDLVEAIVKYYTDIKEAETGYENAVDAKADAEDAYNQAEIAYDAAIAAGKDPESDEVKDLKATLDKANEALNGKAGEEEGKKTGAIADLERAEKNKQDIENAKTENIKKLLDIKGEGDVALRDIIYKNYKVLNYSSLQNSYNEEIRMNLAKEINYYLDKYITLKGDDILPQDAIDEAYEHYYEAYEYMFYNSTDSSTSQSYYSKFDGNFEAFLIDQVAKDEEDDTITTLSAAKAAMVANAEEVIAELVKVYLLADTYGVLITDDDYEEFKDELEDYYYYYILYYKNFDIETMLGKTNIEAACQFDKLMNYFLEFEEEGKDAEPDPVTGYTVITYKYISGKVSYSWGEPASESK